MLRLDRRKFMKSLLLFCAISPVSKVRSNINMDQNVIIVGNWFLLDCDLIHFGATLSEKVKPQNRKTRQRDISPAHDHWE